MGVFTSSRQVRQNIYLMPSWWLSGASIDLDFQNGRYYDSSLGGSAPLAPLASYLSCSRASTKYAKTSAGVLTSFGNDALAITNLGLLVEDARTNAMENSENLAVFTAQNDTVSSDVAVAPNGATTADKHIKNSGGGATGRYRGITTTGTSTWTSFFKSAEYNFGCLVAIDDAGNRYSIVADLTSGAITSTNSVGSPTVVATSTESYANGWWRLAITLSGANGSTIGVSSVDSGTPSFANAFPSFVGDGTSGCYIWGMQVESGSFPSSYIPTSGASATRAADAVTMAGGLSTVALASTASMVFAFGDVQTSRTNNDACLFSRGGSNSFVRQGDAGSDTGHNHADLWNGTTELIATMGSGTWTGSASNKMGLSWDGTGRSLVLNSGTVANDANAIGTATTAILGGSAVNNNPFFYCKRLTAWNSRLSNATLQGLTAP